MIIISSLKITFSNLTCSLLFQSQFYSQVFGKSQALNSARYDGEEPIGLIQIYKVDKFPPAKHKFDLPPNLWGVDIFIGEEALLGKGIGSAALKLFIEKYANFDYLLIDPHKDNIAAIKAYQKCDFKEKPEMRQSRKYG